MKYADDLELLGKEEETLQDMLDWPMETGRNWWKSTQTSQTQNIRKRKTAANHHGKPRTRGSWPIQILCKFNEKSMATVPNKLDHVLPCKECYPKKRSVLISNLSLELRKNLIKLKDIMIKWYKENKILLEHCSLWIRHWTLRKIKNTREL